MDALSRDTGWWCAQWLRVEAHGESGLGYSGGVDMADTLNKRKCAYELKFKIQFRDGPL